MRSLTKLPIYSLANDCGGAEGKEKGEEEESFHWLRGTAMLGAAD